MKFIYVLLMCLCSVHSLSAQTEVESLVQQGVQYHDRGEYKKAISYYNRALAINPNSTLANYEMSFSYYMLKDYRNAIKYCDRVIAQGNSTEMIPAYITKGSALDDMGNRKESIQCYKKGIEATGGNYLLSYNLGMDYMKDENYKEAERTVMQAIELNSSHASSHLLLSVIESKMGSGAKSNMAAYYFLLLEPKTERSQNAWDIIDLNYSGLAKKTGDNQYTINIQADDDTSFLMVNLALTLMSTDMIENKNNKKSEFDQKLSDAKKFFNLLNPAGKQNTETIWWDFYAPFLYDLSRTDYMNTYMYYITQYSSASSRTWLSSHGQQVTQFSDWVADQE